MRVFLYTNTERDPELRVTLEVAKRLHELQCAVFMPLELYRSEMPPYIRIADGEARYDLVVSLGGDGTILSVSSFAARQDIPIFGINLGNLGFMTAIEKDDIDQISCIAGGEFTVQERIRLLARVVRNGKLIFETDALNDAVIAKGEIARMIPLTIDSDGSVISELTCDGVIVATPTGSTAYSMSAGGPIVEPTAHNFIVTPICAHTYYAGSIVLASERTVGVRLGELDKRSAQLSLDGSESLPLQSGDKILITAAACRTKLAALKGRSFYDILRDKLSNV